MNFCEPISPTCDTCLELQTGECDSVNIITENLNEGEEYFLIIVDQFDNKFSSTLTIDENKSFSINLPTINYKSFSKYGGKLEIYLSSNEQGYGSVALTVGGLEYNCVLIELT